MRWGYPSPYVSVINSTTVLLMNIPTKGLKPNCPLNKYIVKVREEKSGYIMTRSINGVADQLTIRYLEPNSNYSVRIIPKDCEGRNRISDWIFFTTSSPPIPEPARLTRTIAFSNSIFVSWSPPEGAALVQGYVVGYGEGVPEVNWQYLEANRTNMTIKNLKKNTQYVVSVRAYNSGGKGPAVYEVVQTKDDLSDLTPLSPILEAKVMSATSIALRWTDPSLPPATPSTPEDNRYYSVLYRYNHPHDGKAVEKTEISKKTEMVLTRLYANTEYWIRVRTVKDGQAGPYSLPVGERTLEAAPPQPPRMVTIDVVKVDEEKKLVDVLVSWKPPKLTNGNITSYLVQYTDNLELSGDEWTAITVKDRTQVTISNLVYGGSYYFRVQAKNSQGFGPKTFILKMFAILDKDKPGKQGKASQSDPSKPVQDTDKLGDEGKKEPKKKHQHKGTFNLLHTDANKTKREQNLASPEDAHFNDLHPYQGINNVDFKVMLQVKINGFITWPERHPSSNCLSSPLPMGYKFLYRRVSSSGSETDWEVRHLNVNMYVMENLEVNMAYEYKVAYLMEGEPPLWTRVHHLSTSPDHHEPID